MRKTYGYIRLWPDETDADSQLITLREMQVSDKNIYIDRQTDDGCGCMQYHKLLKTLKANDLLYIKSLDALGSDYKEIGRQWRMITREKTADVVVLDIPQLDTRRGKTQFGTLVADLVLSMLEYVPGVEHTARRQKQMEGIASARRSGVRFGRPLMPLPDNFDQICGMWQRGEIKGQKAAELCHMSRASFYRKVHIWEERQENSGKKCVAAGEAEQIR